VNPPRRPEEARTRKNATFPPNIKGKTLIARIDNCYGMDVGVRSFVRSFVRSNPNGN